VSEKEFPNPHLSKVTRVIDIAGIFPLSIVRYVFHIGVTYTIQKPEMLNALALSISLEETGFLVWSQFLEFMIMEQCPQFGAMSIQVRLGTAIAH
jgi:hypothetical protein